MKHKRPRLGEDIQHLAKRLRARIREVPKPEPHTTQFSIFLDSFIVSQREHLAEMDRKRAAASWTEPAGAARADAHHHLDDVACPACGTDSTVGCIARVAP